MQTFHVEGRSVLVVQIDESEHKPVFAKDENGKSLAYIRIKDENILDTQKSSCIRGRFKK
jgi:predicted HTH transcriptional regulator